jgi:hypothetical protein
MSDALERMNQILVLVAFTHNSLIRSGGIPSTLIIIIISIISLIG